METETILIIFMATLLIFAWAFGTYEINER